MLKSYKSVINEIKSPSSFNQKEHLKMLNNFKSDLRKLNKIYKGIKPEIDKDGRSYTKASQLRVFEAKKIFNTFSKNFEDWVYGTLLNASLFGSSIEPPEHRKVREDAWPAVHVFNLGFPDVYYGDGNYVHDMAKLDREMEKYIRTWNAVFSKAFKTLESYISNNKVSSNYPTFEDITINGVLIRIKGTGREPEDEKDIKNFIQNVAPQIFKLYDSKGIKTALRKLTVLISLKYGGAAGRYNHNETVTIYKWALKESNEEAKRILAHEIAHRFYYEMLPKKARKLWDDVIINSKINITADHTKKFIDLFDTDGKFLKTAKRTIENISDPHEYASFVALSQMIIIDKRTTKEKIKRSANDLIGYAIHKEFITEYAGKNASEAFAEALALYIINGPSRLGPWTRDFLKRIVRTTGVTLKEERSVQNPLKSYKSVTCIGIPDEHNNFLSS